MTISPLFSGIPLQVMITFILPALRPYYYFTMVDVIVTIAGPPVFLFPVELVLVEPLLVEYYPSRTNDLPALRPSSYYYNIRVDVIVAIAGHPATLFPVEIFLVELLLVEYYLSRVSHTSGVYPGANHPSRVYPS
jgi:hypothetical protein